jgi:hypothetical protein
LYPAFEVLDEVFHVGNSWLSRTSHTSASENTPGIQLLIVSLDFLLCLPSTWVFPESLSLLQGLLSPLEHVMKCVEMNWPCVLVGGAATGKTSLVRLLSQLTHNVLHEFAMSSSVDATELLGCFEQVDLSRHKKTVLFQLHALLSSVCSHLLVEQQGTFKSKTDIFCI